MGWGCAMSWRGELHRKSGAGILRQHLPLDLRPCRREAFAPRAVQALRRTPGAGCFAPPLFFVLPKKSRRARWKRKRFMCRKAGGPLRAAFLLGCGSCWLEVPTESRTLLLGALHRSDGTTLSPQVEPRQFSSWLRAICPSCPAAATPAEANGAASTYHHNRCGGGKLSILRMPLCPTNLLPLPPGWGIQRGGVSTPPF